MLWAENKLYSYSFYLKSCISGVLLGGTSGDKSVVLNGLKDQILGKDFEGLVKKNSITRIICHIKVTVSVH